VLCQELVSAELFELRLPPDEMLETPWSAHRGSLRLSAPAYLGIRH
jgi:hypothetical protein